MAGKKKRPVKRRNQPIIDHRARIATWLDRALVYVVAVLLFSTPLFMSTSISEYGYGKTIYALVGISLLTVLWSVTAWLKDRQSLRWPWLGFPFLAFVAASLFSLLAAVNGRVVIQGLVLVIYFFQLLLIIAHVVRSRRDVYLLLFAMLSAGLLAGLYGLLQHIGILRGPYGGTGLREVISMMGNRNYLGGFLAYLLFPCVILVLSPRQRWVRLISCAMVAFCFGIVLLVDQAATVVALSATAVAFLVGVFMFRSYATIRRNRGWIVLLLAFLAITAAVHAPPSPLNSFVGLSADQPGPIARFWQSHSGQTREFDYWVGWEMFKNSPLVGIGLGHYKIRFLEFKDIFLSTARGQAYTFSLPPAAQAHNDYIQALAEVGALGAMAVIGFLLALAVSIWRRIRRSDEPDERSELLLLACGILPVLIHAAVSFPAHLPASSLVFVALIGLALSRAYGDVGVVVRTLSRRAIRAGACVLSAVAIVVAGFAVSDVHANILMQQGIQRLQQGDLRTGEDLLQRSLRFDFAPRQTYYFLASAQLQQNRADEAWENLERCLTRYVDEAVYLTYANVAANRGELEKAQWAVGLLLSGNPTRDVEQQARYIEAVIAFHSQGPQRAVDLLEGLTADHRAYVTGWIALGDLYAMMNRHADARAALERGITLADQQIDRAWARLRASQGITLAEHAQLRLDINRLEQQRELAHARLAGLP